MKNPEFELESYQLELAEINAAYSDVTDSDSYTLVYIPKDGLSLHQEGRLLVRIGNRDFASHYYGIWLSTYSLDGSLTRKLLDRTI